MKKINVMFLYRIVLMLLCFAISAASTAKNVHAVPMIDTWTARIESGYTSGLSLNDEISWTVMYDDESQQMHNFSDGVNGIAEGGQGDDTLHVTYDIMSYLGTFSFFSDSITDISTLLLDIAIPPSSQAYDLHLHNQDVRYAAIDGTQIVNLVQDNIDFYASINGSSGSGEFHQQVLNGQGNWISYSTYFTVESVESQLVATPVPEPSTIMLLGSGFVGLAFMCRKRMSQ